jgi:O-antigen/teichoic acid export membrane protein
VFRLAPPRTASSTETTVRPASSRSTPGATVAAGGDGYAPETDRTGPDRAGSDPAADRSGQAVREATPLAFAGFVANAANVLVTLAVARILSTSDYGTQAQLVAIFFVVSMPGSALLVGIVRRATRWQTTGHTDLIPAWARRIRRVGLAVVAVVAVLATALCGLLGRALSVDDRPGIVAVLVAGAAWGLLCVDRGLLQARHAYRGLAVNLLVEGGLRSALTVVLVVAGAGSTGVAAGLLLGVASADVHARWHLHRHAVAPDPARATTPDDAGGFADLDPGPPVPPALALPRERRLITDVGIALVALGLLGLLQNVDVVILGRERPSATGAYAAISVASKALVFAALVLSSFLLPEAASRRNVGEHALRQLGGTLAIFALPATLLVGFAVIAPEFLIKLAFGPRYLSAAHALWPLAVAMTCLGATVLFTHYLLGAGHRRAVIALLIGTAVAIPLLLAADGDPRSTAMSDLAVQAALAAVTGGLVLLAALRPRKISRPRRIS